MSRTIAIQAAVAMLTVASPAAAVTISMEVAAERGADLNAQRQWLQLLADVGVSRPRIRTAGAGDRPQLESTTTGSGEVHRLVGVLERSGRLVLPGGAFTQRDRAKLRDYLDRLKADGREGVMAARGENGLTTEQFTKVFDELAKPLGAKTAGQRPMAIVSAAGERLGMTIEFAPGAAGKLNAAPAMQAELRELTTGAALAMTVRSAGLELVPTRPRGGAPRLSIQPAGGDGKPWPIGYEVKGPPRNTAPSLMQAIEVEIDGFSLAEATGAIVPRLKFPVVWDTAELARRNIVPEEIQVKLPRAKLSYKRILDKLLFQARLRGELRIDEAGKPFYWISK